MPRLFDIATDLKTTAKFYYQKFEEKNPRNICVCLFNLLCIRLFYCFFQEAYTRVLIGHIDLALGVFRNGIYGEKEQNASTQFRDWWTWNSVGPFSICLFLFFVFQHKYRWLIFLVERFTKFVDGICSSVFFHAEEKQWADTTCTNLSDVFYPTLVCLVSYVS